VRVVVVSAWEPWRTSDGAAFVLDHQLQRLAARHDITVLAAGAPIPEVDPVRDVVGRYGSSRVSWFGTELASGADYLRRLAWSARHGEPAHVAYVERPSLLDAYDDALASGADVVHLHGWGTAGLAARAAPVPAVHVAIDPWAANYGNRRRTPLRRVLDAGQQRRVAHHERHTYPDASAVVVVTEADAEIVQALAPDATVEVIPNGVDAGPEPAPPSERHSVLGFHGVFDSQANVDAAVSLVTEIWPRVRQSVPTATVVLVGRRPPREVRRLVGQGVELRADVPDIRVALADMSVHVDWMTSGAGIKNKVLEAMAAGRPAVASAGGAQGIGAGPGLLVAADVEGAAAEVVRLLDDRALLAVAGADARARVVADFSWDANAAAVEQLWEKAASQ
jgi:glycosyltransferase involved in cell wall biosynthesis